MIIICRILDIAISADHRIKFKESEKRDMYLDLAREIKKNPMKHKGDGDTSCNWSTRNNTQRIGKGAGKLRKRRTSGDHLDYSIVKIGQNTEKSPGDLRRFAVAQTPEEKKSANADMKNSQRR